MARLARETFFRFIVLSDDGRQRAWACRSVVEHELFRFHKQSSDWRQEFNESGLDLNFYACTSISLAARLKGQRDMRNRRFAVLILTGLRNRCNHPL